MVKNHLVNQKMCFSDLKTFLSWKTYFGDVLLSTYLLQMVKILFLVKNGQKCRHGCVKSEHILLMKSISECSVSNYSYWDKRTRRKPDNIFPNSGQLFLQRSSALLQPSKGSHSGAASKKLPLQPAEPAWVPAQPGGVCSLVHKPRQD